MVVKDFFALAAAVAHTARVRTSNDIDSRRMFDFRLLLLLLVTLKTREWEILFNTQLRSSVMSCRSKYNQWRVMECEAMDGRRMAVAKRRKTFISYFFSLSLGQHCNRDKSRPRKNRSPFSQHDVHCQLYSNKKIYHQHIFLALLVNYRNNLTSCHRHPQEVAAFLPTHTTRLITVPSKYRLSQAR